MWLLVVALLGFIVPNGFFIYWLLFEFHGLGPVVHDKLAVGFILDVFLALVILAVYFARHPLGAVKWYWFVVLSFAGGLGFSLPLYYWLNRRRAASQVAVITALLLMALARGASAQLPAHVTSSDPPKPVIGIGPHETITLLNTFVFVPAGSATSERRMTIYYGTSIPAADTAGRRRQASRVVETLGHMAQERGIVRLTAMACERKGCDEDERFVYRFRLSRSGRWRAERPPFSHRALTVR